MSENQSNEKQIALFKLVSGEEVISEYKNDEQFYVLKAPRKIYLERTPQGVFRKMGPWIVSVPDGVFPVMSHHVMTVSSEMDEDILKGYISQTSVIDQSQVASTNLVV